MKYKVTVESDYIPDPEESLVVPVDERVYIGRPLETLKFKWLSFSVTVFFIVVGLLIGKFIIYDGVFFTQQAFDNEYTNHFIQPARGTIYDKNLTVLADSRPLFKIILFKNATEGTIETLSEVLDMNSGDIEVLFSEDNEKTITIENILPSLADEIKSRSLEGVFLIEEAQRFYTDGPFFSHMIGYASEVDQSDLQDEFYRQKDLKGKNGIEFVYEEYLRGTRGYFYISRLTDVEPIRIPAERGNDVILNIDSDLQKIVYMRLKEGLDIVGSKKGVGIVQNPNTGEILALVNFPTYDNNLFVGGIDKVDYSYLINDTSKPLLNRIIGGRFSPGSTIKPLFAIAALEEGIIDPYKKVYTNGSITIVNPYDPNVTYTFNDWKNHGSVNMLEAIANSVDVYFYILGGGYRDFVGLGIDRMSDYLSRFYADAILGIDLPGEIKGFVPTRDLKLELKGEPWYVGDSYNVSIGQGDLLVTPLWINTYVGAIANGGTIYKPFVVNKIINQNGESIKKFNAEIIDTLSISSYSLELIQKGMRMAVTDGTIKRYLDNVPLTVAAKTGTAEVIKGKTVNSFVTLFAPYKNPEISMTILVENAQEGLSIAPFIAEKILADYFNARNSFSSQQLLPTN